jgi:hypothetical protein
VGEILEECSVGDTPCFISAWGHVPHHTITPTDAAMAVFADLVVNESLLPADVMESVDACRDLVGDPAQNELKQ